MERVWMYDDVAVSVLRVDFLDPAVASEPDARERGVRVEVRPARTTATGSIYASDGKALDQAVARLDFLESAPGRADRMHWHPDMDGGEPGDRTFDVDMPADPVGWLVSFLRGGLRDFLTEHDRDVSAYDADLGRIGDDADEIARALSEGLAWAREPWPEVTHDARGMAVAG